MLEFLRGCIPYWVWCWSRWMDWFDWWAFLLLAADFCNCDYAGKFESRVGLGIELDVLLRLWWLSLVLVHDCGLRHSSSRLFTAYNKRTADLHADLMTSLLWESNLRLIEANSGTLINLVANCMQKGHRIKMNDIEQGCPTFFEPRHTN
jgi:hypothetical protein